MPERTRASTLTDVDALHKTIRPKIGDGPCRIGHILAGQGVKADPGCGAGEMKALDTLTIVTVADSGPPESAALLPAGLRLLALLTTAQGLIMLSYAAADLLVALINGAQEWGAVWFLVVGLGLWGSGLLWVAHGLRRRRRWAFTPVVFTQLMFAVLAVSFFGGAATTARIVWALILVFAVVVLRLAFSGPVRDALITPRSPSG